MGENKVTNGLIQLQEQKYISIVTFRRNGDGVPTPVWFVEDNHKIYICTDPNTFKIKRIKNNPHVQIAPSNSRGTVSGKYFDAKAQIFSERIESIYKSFRRKYRMFRLWSSFHDLRKKEGEKQIFVEITPN